MYVYIYIYIYKGYQQQHAVIVTPCNDNWLMLLISCTNVLALFVTLITLLEIVDNLNFDR